MEERRRQILSLVDPEAGLGLEVGALDKPVVTRDMGRILYADHVSAADLRSSLAAHAATGAVRLEAIVEVDIVVPGGRGLAAALGPRGPVDYVVASHVIEHIPDVIGWLRDIAECLRDHGKLCLAVPDKRFIFDTERRETGISDLVDAFLRGPDRPTPGQIYDSIANTVEADGGGLWFGRPIPARAIAGHDPVAALAAARLSVETGVYRDVHCSVFTPWSFLEAVRAAMALDLVPFTVAAFAPTAFGHSEFFATLEKRPGESPAARAATVPRLDRRLHHDLPVRADPRIRRARARRAWRRLRRLLGR